MQRVAEVEFNFNMMIYGPPGVGKTVLCGSAAEVAEMAPVLFVDVEGGTLSVAAQGFDVDVVRVKSWGDIQAIYDDLYDGKSPYKTVVLDSLTEIQKFSMLQVMEDLVSKEVGRDPDIPGLREWGKNIEQTRKFVRGFRDLPLNTIFTALSMDDRNTRTGVTTKKPSLSGKLSNEVAGFLDIVVYMYKKTVNGEIQRLLLSQETEDIVAKDRSDQLPSVVQHPSMQKLYDLITGKQQEAPTQENPQE